MSELRSPLSKVKGLGSAKDGTGHFWHQRLTALLLIPLVLWLGFSLAAMPIDHATLADWIQQTWVTVALVLLLISGRPDLASVDAPTAAASLAPAR